MSDVITVADLEETKKHNTFHVDVITGRTGDYATNAVTGQVQKTLPATIDGLDWSYVGKFADGVTFTKQSDFALDASNTQWIYVGASPFPVVVSAGTVPSAPDYQVVHVNNHNLLEGRSDPNSHPASAINTASGSNVEDAIAEAGSHTKMTAAIIRDPDKAANDHMLMQSRVGPFRAHMEPDRPIEDGTVSKLDWMLDPYDGGSLVPYPDSDVNYRIFNIFTKTGEDTGLNGENGAAIIGTKNRADGETWGVFTSMHFGFNDGKSVPMKMYYMDHSDTEWRAPMKNFWYTGKPLNTNDYVLSGRRLYKCLTTGVCGAAQPVHLTGTVSDGNLNFEFMRDYASHVDDIGAVVLFGSRDLMPKFGHQENVVQFASDPMIWAGVRTKHLSSGRQTGFGLVKSGVRTDAEAWQLEFHNNNRFRVYEDRYSTVGIVKQYNTATLTDVDIVGGQLQIPAGAEQVEVNLTTPAAISSISKIVGHQHITIIDIAGNLTLNDTTKIKTKDGLPLTMRAGTGRMFAVSLGGTLIREL